MCVRDVEDVKDRSNTPKDLTAPDRCYYLNQAYLSCVYSRSEKGEDQ